MYSAELMKSAPPWYIIYKYIFTRVYIPAAKPAVTSRGNRVVFPRKQLCPLPPRLTPKRWPEECRWGVVVVGGGSGSWLF